MRQSKAEFVMLTQANTHFSREFFEQLSYGFATGADALIIRRFFTPNNSLASAQQTLQTVFTQVLRNGAEQTVTELEEGISFRRKALLKDVPLTARTVLFDNYALSTDQLVTPSPAKTLVTGASILVSLALLFALTPLDLLIYVGALIYGLLLVSFAIFTLQAPGFTLTQKIQLLLYLPFYPLVYVLSAIVRALVQATKVVRRAVQQLRPRQQSRTR